MKIDNKKLNELNKVNRDIKIIVSLTSYPARINKVAETIMPLFLQTLLPDRVILWLAKDQFKRREKQLPKDLLYLKKYGLEIAWCDDLKPHKKYFYAMKESPNDIIITVDDDVVYTNTLIETLYKSFQRFPHAISAMRVHKIIFNKNKMPRNYEQWIKEYPAEIFEPRYDLIPTGAGGVLYPPHCMPEMAFNETAIRETCLWGDDLWLKVMSLLNDFPVVLAAKQKRLQFIKGTQESGLYQNNVDKNLNDEQMNKIISYLSVNKSIDDIFGKAYAESGYLYDNDEPKVSIVMPVYNVEKYLKNAIDSVLNQYLREIEVICVNDGSTDSSLSILKEYQKKDNRVVVIDKKNSGYGDSMNKGIYAARGEYIGIVETDDFILPDMYLTLYCIAKEKKLDLIKGDIIQFYKDGKERTTKYISVAGKDPSYYERVIQIGEDYTPLYFTMNTWAGIYRKKYIYDHKIKHNLTPGASYQDSGFWFQTFIWADRMYFLNRPFYYYRQDNPNSSINNPDKVYCVSDEYNYIYRILNRYPNLKAYYIDIFVYRRYYSYMFALSKMGDKYKYNFLKRFSKDFRNHREAGEINPMLFTAGEYNRLKMIMDNSARYYVENFYDGKNLYDRDVELKLAIAQDELKKCKTELSRLKKNYFIKGIIKIEEFIKKINSIFNLAHRGYMCLSENGLAYTKQRIRQKLNELRLKNKSKKAISAKSKNYTATQGLKVLFIASDNSPSSGAFLSMTNLAYQLKTKFNISPFVILPKGGKGGFLLDEYKIGHKTIPSEDWVIPLDTDKNRKLKATIRRKRNINRKAIKFLTSFIKENNYDIVHLNTTYIYVGAIAARKAKVPFIWHLREFLEEDQEKTLWDRQKGNKLINSADKVIAISESLFDKYKPIISKDKLCMIHNGINHELFFDPDKKIFMQDKSIFIFVGGFAIYKGHIEFAKAIVEIFRRGLRNFEVWFIGTGNPDIRAKVEEMFNSEGLAEHYKILGYRKDVAQYYKKADISFTCARSEAFGRTTVEAMMAGTLLIGANAAGAKDLIKHGKTGLFYESGNYVDLADQIVYALNNKEKMRAIAHSGQNYMYENMTAEENARRISDLYHQLNDINY